MQAGGRLGARLGSGELLVNFSQEQSVASASWECDCSNVAKGQKEVEWQAGGPAVVVNDR